jgi:hypothetical protein
MKNRRLLTSFFAIALVQWGCSAERIVTSPQVDISQQRFTKPAGTVPLTDMGTSSYKGFPGGLYPPSTNTMPAPHTSEGLAAANAVQPRDTAGALDPLGKYVLLTVGMSNTRDESCSHMDVTIGCDAWSFLGTALTDSTVNHSALVLVNAAGGALTPTFWDSPSDAAYGSARNELAQLGVSEKQVEVVWIKEANSQPTVSLPAKNADAYTLESGLGKMLRALKIVYPNLKQVFLSSRIYAGYATGTLNPEPYAYEGGFSAKWVIAAQINQLSSGKITDTVAGDLSYTVAPWVAWGPYLWAAGTTPRSDGLVWLTTDFTTDGTHPSTAGITKVAGLLMSFFKSSPLTKCWFVVGGVCS